MGKDLSLCNADDIKWIGESCLHKNYGWLYRFYQGVWVQSHDYVVMNTRRCFNLNYIFMRMHEADGKPVANADRIISDNALLLYSGKIAEYYGAYGRFPRILIVDALVLHGRGIEKLLHDLEYLIVSQLSPFREMTKDERYYVRRKLANAIDISVFAVNRQPLLIDSIYLRNLRGEEQLYTREMRSLFQQCSGFLQRVNVPNTSYVLSYQIEGIPSPGEKWLCQPWSYRGAKQQIYFAYGRQADVKFLPTVRFRETFVQNNRAGIWLTSLILFGELTFDGLPNVCRKVEENLDSCEFCGICAILRND